MQSSRRLLRIALGSCSYVALLAASFGQISEAKAGNASWSGITADWFSSTNWSSGVVPDGTTSLTIGTGIATISSGTANSSNTTIDSGAKVDVSGPSTVWNNDGSSQSFNTRGGAIIVGGSGAGTLSIENGATVETTGRPAGTVLIGNLSGSTGLITVGNGTGTSSLVNAPPNGYQGNFYVGYEGSGTLNVNAGGRVTGFDGMTLGVAAGGVGKANIDGGSLDVSALNGSLTIGNRGTGTLSVTNGGQLTSFGATIASGPGSAGSSATVDGEGSIWNVTGPALQIGIGASGELTVRDGGKINFNSGSSRQLYVSDGIANGSLTIDGGELDAGGAEGLLGAVGSGSATVVIENGGVLKTSRTYVGGGAAGGSGTATISISGAGSLWDATVDVDGNSAPSSALIIANPSGGTAVDIRAGGKLISGLTEVGGDGSPGTSTALNVDGVGSSWVSPYESIIGYEGGYDVGQTEASSGAVIISGGATASSATMIVGRNPDSNNPSLPADQLTVTGSGSSLTVSPGNSLTGALDIGYLGSGQLTVSDGGTVSADHALLGYSSASSGLWSTNAPAMNSFGVATITGAGSSWAIDKSLIVGDNVTATTNGQLGVFAIGAGTSQGTLTVSDGASVTDASAVIAANPRAVGTVTVTGSGSNWATTGNVQLGLGGTGTISVLNSGMISATDFQIYSQGTLALATGTVNGAIDGGSAGTGALTTAEGTALISGNVGSGASLGSVDVSALTGHSSLTIDGSLSAAHTSVSQSGTLTIGTGGTIGSIASDIDDNGAIIVNHSDDVALAGSISGTGTLDLQGTGRFTINGTSNALTGLTTVEAGTLIVGDDAHHDARLSGDVSVESGATLGGHGTVGTTEVLSGGTLSPGASIGTLTVNGDLTMDQGSNLNFEFDTPGTPAAPGASDNVSVLGNLTLEGANLSVTDAGHMGPGVYRLFDYSGSLTQANGGILTPTGAYTVEYLTADKQINLINAAGQTLNFWNANGLASSSQRGGGDGLWSNTSVTWTDATGSLTSAMTPQPGFAIFGGAAGAVTIDNRAGAVEATGLQFASSGYSLSGDRLTLVADSGHSAPVEVEVGDGSAGSASWTASINNELAGTDGLRKTGLGTLVLTGANTYSGGTEIDAGELSVSQDANLGAAAGTLTFDGGVLKVSGTAFTSTSRNILWGNSGGGFDIDDALNDFTVSQSLNGSGGLLKLGAGTLTLSAANSYSGGTTIQQGTLAVATTGALGTGSVDIGTDSTLKFLDGTDAGTLSLTTESSTGAGVSGGSVHFEGDSNADHAQIENGVLGSVEFSGSAVGNSAGIDNNGGKVSFVDDSDAQSARISNGSGGSTAFLDRATAGHAEISNGSDGEIDFFDTSTAANASIVNNAGVVRFNNSASAGSSAITNGSGGSVLFADSSDAAGATIINNAGATLDISKTTAGIAIGSLSGEGGVSLGSKTLTIGGLGTSDTIDGTLEDGGAAGDTGGSLVKTGAGTLTLNGVNTYTGTTTVDGGALVVGDDTHPDASIMGSLSVADGAMLGGAGTLGGNVTIADGGTLAPGNSPGTLSINGNLSLSSGSLLSFDFGQAGVAGGSLNDLVNVSGDLVLDGTLTTTISPGGSFGPGIYRLFGYGGALTDNGLELTGTAGSGEVFVQTSVANQVNLINTAGLTLNYWDGAGPTFDGRVEGGSGTWQATGGDNWTDAAGKSNGFYTNGSFDIFAGAAGTVTVDDHLGTVTTSGMQFASNGYILNGDAIELTGTQATIRVGDGTAAGIDYTATISSDLTGTAGLEKADLGTLVLNGRNSYTGNTDILSGKLVVNGSIAGSNVMVGAGSTLGGIGLVGGTVVQSGGTIAPGNSIGTITINGNYSQASGGIYKAEVDPTSSAGDKIAVSGSANLADGAIIDVTKTAKVPYVVGNKYTVLTASGGLTGTFDLTGDTDLSAFLGLSDAYDADNAYLVVGQTRSIASAGKTSNQKATGRGLDGLSPTNPLMVPILNLSSADGVPPILDLLSGEIHASAQTAMMNDSRFARDAAIDRVREAFCDIGVTSTTNNDDRSRKAPASSTQADCSGNTDRATSWARAIGSWGETHGNGNAATLDQSIGGFFAGVDVPVSQIWRIGALAGYTHSNFDVDARNSSGSSDDYHVGAYGGAQAGALGFRTGAVYTWHDVSTQRSVSFSGFSGSPSADYHAGTMQVFGDLGYRIDTGAIAFEPFANLAYVDLHTDSFDEKGNAAALRGESSSMNTTFTTVGLRGSTAFAIGDMDLSANGSIGWRHAMGDVTPTSNLAFSGGNSFTIDGVPVAKDAAVAEVGVDLRVAPNTTFGLSYSGQFGSHANDQGVKGALQVKF